MLAPVLAPFPFRPGTFLPGAGTGRIHPCFVTVPKWGPIADTGCPFENWVPKPNTITHTKWSCHVGATTETNSPSAGTGTLQCPSARTGMVPGWAPTYTSCRVTALSLKTTHYHPFTKFWGTSSSTKTIRESLISLVVVLCSLVLIQSAMRHQLTWSLVQQHDLPSQPSAFRLAWLYLEYSTGTSSLISGGSLYWKVH